MWVEILAGSGAVGLIHAFADDLRREAILLVVCKRMNRSDWSEINWVRPRRTKG